MRKTFWISMVAIGLASGAGCKQHDEQTKALEKAEHSVAKAQENVKDQARDVVKEEKEVRRDERALAKDEADVERERRQLSAAEAELALARERYLIAAKQRMDNLNVKLKHLEDNAGKENAGKENAGKENAGKEAKEALAKLCAQRDEIAAKLETIGEQTQASWEAFRKDVDNRFEKLEKELHHAFRQ